MVIGNLGKCRVAQIHPLRSIVPVVHNYDLYLAAIGRSYQQPGAAAEVIR